jgi:hypothetical protein
MAGDLTKVSILARREIEARILSPVIKAFMKEVGETRTLEIIGPIIQSLAREAGQNLVKILGGNTVEHFITGLSFWTLEDALQIDILEQTPKKFSFNVTRCRYADMYKELGTSELGHLLSCGRDKALIEGFNPNIKFTRTQTIMEGAKHCDFRYELKDS